MRLIVTADLHYNHGRSRATADEVIARINAAGCDVLLLVGDAAIFDGDSLERCLSAFTHRGPKLFVAGNHELWSYQLDSYPLFTEQLPRRVRACGWNWLEGAPFIADQVAIAGTIGWYDYTFAPASLNIPRRFYERKISPGSAAQLEPELLGSDVPPAAMEIFARWNDGRFIRLGRSDEAFLAERLAVLETSLAGLWGKRVVVATHHVPFEELLPPARSPMWQFTRAYLGSRHIGEMLLRHENVSHVFCGHSHFPAENRIGHFQSINLGSGYREKHFRVIDC